ncbi:MAG: hypothetical protein IT215_05950 [Chitinophagaceae bacterium]|nr:hypothetical protein [Chitinophagaceae bacterium]
MIEIIVGVAVILAVVLSLTFVYNSYLKVTFSNTQNIQASSLLEEGVEAVKILRDKSWNENIKNIPLNTPTFLSFDGSTWNATSTKEIIGGVFERNEIFAETYRDNNGDIVKDSGTLDLNTKFVTVNVSWFDQNSLSTSTKSISFYVTNLFNN